MVVFFEVSRPFRRKIKVEKYGALRRYIWLWFSVAYLPYGFNDIARAIREDDRERKRGFKQPSASGQDK